ncbi:hypothetical protein C1E23_13220 [Pseudoalteromonas phenolica]|uniref:Solute-binding protein family 3/N-terminal domain-containing protein n=1 Tax=Pseudoalteromonas phenolica TaxID=161398 RepID=A0A4Q7ILR2_9GAMM|nr:hypothetical protein C1E23_13220 [Pseudoalteromonas phenolica]
MDIELTKTLLNQAGCTYKFWGRALKMLETGSLDMMMSVSKTTERSKYIHFIGPQGIEQILVVSKASPKIILNRFEDIKSTPLPIGVQEGAFYGSDFTKFVSSLSNPDAYFFKVPNNDLKPFLLMKDRTFRFLEEKLNIDYEIRHPLALKDVYIQPPLITNKVTGYFALNIESLSHQTINKHRKGLYSVRVLW